MDHQPNHIDDVSTVAIFQILIHVSLDIHAVNAFIFCIYLLTNSPILTKTQFKVNTAKSFNQLNQFQNALLVFLPITPKLLATEDHQVLEFAKHRIEVTLSNGKVSYKMRKKVSFKLKQPMIIFLYWPDLFFKVQYSLILEECVKEKAHNFYADNDECGSHWEC